MRGAALPCQPVAARVFSAHLIGMADKDREREERLAAALRENLRKRKAQSRAASRAVQKAEPKDKGEGE